MVSEAQENVELARFTFSNNFLVGNVSPDCMLGGNFLANTAAQVNFKVKKLPLHQGDKTSRAQVQEEACDQEEETRNKKSRELSAIILDA